MRDRLHGILPPVVTTFDARDDVDRGALAANVARYMRARLTGVLVLGSNGESALLDEHEADVVVATAREVVPRDRLLVVGTGRESTKATVAASVRAARAGADAVLVRAPFFFRSRMTPAALLAHYTAVADGSPVPVLLYNLPDVTGVTLTRPIVSALAGHPNVVGMKETSPDLERLGQFTAIDGFKVFSGWAPVAYPAIVSGAAGAILAVANVLPELCVELYDLAVAGRHTEALALQRRLTPIAQLVSSGHGVAGLKVALDLAGYRGGPVRAPLQPLAPGPRDEIARALEAIAQHAC